MANKSRSKGEVTEVSELQDIKKLLILALIQQGISQGQIAQALNVNQSSISRMFPKGIGKPDR